MPGIGYDAAVSATVGLPMHRAGSEVRDREEAERKRVSFFWASRNHSCRHSAHGRSRLWHVRRGCRMTAVVERSSRITWPES
ncbi:hypothetical protein SEA_KENUHA5_46 [Mycobacterium phage Kenuha5]|nr:hypothetical protein SEA_KENUHA5_46 [Mycobacterium phage Kenuha5]